MNPNTCSQDPEFNSLALDVLCKALNNTGNPVKAGEYLAEEILKFTAARCVLFVHCPCDSAEAKLCIVIASPANLREGAGTPQLERLHEILCQHRSAQIWRARDSSPAAKILHELGYDLSLFIPMQGGPTCMGGMLVLSLPDEERIPSALGFLNALAPVAALLLHNAFLYGRQEQIIHERTADLQKANAQLQVELGEHRRVQAALWESENKYRTVADFTYNWEFWISPEGKYIYVSPSCERITGYRPEDFQKDPSLMISITHPDDRAIVAQHLEDSLIKSREPFNNIFFRIVDRKGEIHWISHVCQMVYGPDGAWQGRRGSNQDITESKRAEEALRKSEEQTRLFFERQIVGMSISAPNMTWLKVNDRLCQMLGYSREELTNKSWIELSHPEDAAVSAAQFKRLVTGETDEYTLEKRYLRKDGSVIFANLSVGCVRRPDGSLDYVLALIEDITDRKRMQEELAEKVAQLEAALATVKKLEGIIPICMYCKKIRNDRQSWQKMEEYITEHSEACFSHGICPECAQKMMSEINALEPEK